MSTATAPAVRNITRETAALSTLCILGIALLLVTDVALRTDDILVRNLFVLLLLASGVIAVIATLVAAHAPPRTGLALVLGVALVLRLMVLGHAPLLSNDIYRYVWDGLVQGAGINPYRYVPADPALAALRDAAIFPNINRAEYAHTAYPPVAQFFFYAVTRVSQSVTGMRLALIGCEIVTIILLIDLLRRFNKPPTLATAYAWHPLAVWEVANSGHVEALMVALVVAGSWLLVRQRRIAAGIAITLAALVKPYALAALPACWRPWDWRVPTAVAGVVLACYVPYLAVGQGVLGFLSTGYLQEEGLADGSGFFVVAAARAFIGDLPWLLPLYLALAAATLGYLALRAVIANDRSPERMTRDVAALLMAALFFLSPNYPWYYLVLVPFIPIGGGAPAWTMSLGALLLYALDPELQAHSLVSKGVISGAFLVAVLATIWLRRPASNRTQGAFQWGR